MEQFAALLDALVYTRSRNGKLALIADYLRRTPDPDRGWALAALTDGLDFKAVKAGTVRALIMERVDPELFALSRDFVGDTAETVSLLWPEPHGERLPPPSVSEAVAALSNMTKATVNTELAALLDRLDANGRYTLLKLATGAMRIGISARLAKVAFAQAFDVSVDEVEEHWHGQTPPYTALFDWAAHGGEVPSADHLPLFRPFMLAHPLEDSTVDLTDYAAEWKWDGIRVQAVHQGGEKRLFSRSGDDISGAFPDVVEHLPQGVVLDGETVATLTAGSVFGEIAALEWVRGWMLSGFGWNGLAVALHRDLPMIQIAELTGALGLAWLVAFVNVMIVIVVVMMASAISAGLRLERRARAGHRRQLRRCPAPRALPAGRGDDPRRGRGDDRGPPRAPPPGLGHHGEPEPGGARCRARRCRGAAGASAARFDAREGDRAAARWHSADGHAIEPRSEALWDDRIYDYRIIWTD